MKKFWRDDAQDKAVDAALSGQVEAVVPTDLENPIPSVATSTTVTVLHPALESLPDEALAAEVARRKTSKIDQQIAHLEATLAGLRAERESLLGNPTAALEPATKPTLVNPITGKTRPNKPKPGSLRPDQCSCGGIGCYLCCLPG